MPGFSVAGGCLRRESGLSTMPQSVALAPDVDSGGMMQQAVEQGRGQHLVGKDVAPTAVALVAGQDDGLLGLVTTADDLKQTR
jgi:hypothetical protein